MTAWSKTAPTEPGWYVFVWDRGNPNDKPGIVHLDSARTREAVAASFSGWWGGKIELPAWPSLQPKKEDGDIEC